MAIEQILGTLNQLAPQDHAKAGLGTSGFGDSLRQLLETAETSNEDANRAVADMVEGRGDVHDAMIALQRADLTFQFTVQVKNKMVQAYQEIMRTPV